MLRLFVGVRPGRHRLFSAKAMPIDIRPTSPEHPQVRTLIGELDAYLASLYEPEDNHILDLEALLHPSVTFLGAWDGETVVGCGAVRVMPAEDETGGAPYGEIKRMYVQPARRGERIARTLLEGLEAVLRGQDVDRALLETGRDQSEALRLYQRCGYATRGTFGGYPDNGLSVFMEKRWTTA
jgi:putative acetyltransferase